jgi:hypothetical protein
MSTRLSYPIRFCDSSDAAFFRSGSECGQALLRGVTSPKSEHKCMGLFDKKDANVYEVGLDDL